MKKNLKHRFGKEKRVSMKRILISRTDSIGDVVLTLPIAGFLKKRFPDAEILFLGTSYTLPVIKTSVNVDEVFNWSDMSGKSQTDKIEFFKKINADVIIHAFPNREIAKCAQLASVKKRIGTSHRIFHYFTCNKLVHFSRRSSPLHESQLNFKLLKPLGIKTVPDLSSIRSYYGMTKIETIPKWLEQMLCSDRYNVVIHPKSKGSAREWSLSNFSELVSLLHNSSCNIFVTGTENEQQKIAEFLIANSDKVLDLTGKLTLEQMIGFLSRIDAIVACSTGPLHLTSALGNVALGLYPPMRPVHPGRWAPVGENSSFIVENKKCNKCRKTTFCECMNNITAKNVFEKLLHLLKSVKQI